MGVKDETYVIVGKVWSIQGGTNTIWDNSHKNTKHKAGAATTRKPRGDRSAMLARTGV